MKAHTCWFIVGVVALALGLSTMFSFDKGGELVVYAGMLAFWCCSVFAVWRVWKSYSWVVASVCLAIGLVLPFVHLMVQLEERGGTVPASALMLGEFLAFATWGMYLAGGCAALFLYIKVRLASMEVSVPIAAVIPAE